LARANVAPSGNHPHLSLPRPDPSHRYIRRSFPEENVELKELIGEIRARDPEPRSIVLQFA